MTREEMAQAIDHCIVGAPIDDANETLVEIAAELRRICEWTEDSDDGNWKTWCGQSFWLAGGDSPARDGFKFCIYCGGQLVERPYIELAEETT